MSVKYISHNWNNNRFYLLVGYNYLVKFVHVDFGIVS